MFSADFYILCLFFPYIIIRHNVAFCKNEPWFMSVIIFHFNLILLMMMRMTIKQFSFHLWQIKAEDWGFTTVEWFWKFFRVSPVQGGASGTSFDRGSHTIIYSASDSKGATAYCYFSFRVSGMIQFTFILYDAFN